ncbi:Putative uncharacterized protein [Mycobacterium tuberculosis variant bovis]|uniref:Uncharacterized protein n=1 Tax=Mycobacterium tuberculosis (strain CDC 1551 / Oshkosh) TaxID=83331 RepID=Q8VJZ1_MYCTO|nr:hypothetical protein MT1742 [Mycobacterium tuberculosis CDC1551]EPZ64710.1 hypothetical protein TBKG_00047 [Mycobacterium tuberculosis '98-R604 INH-RIF-EM']CEJ28780.1 Putative uncharacterized protein [Mycobacterium tuberculosis variant bovis]CEJ52316.1 Putative uncharacterized protein [Mycobacterium tuberculosis variant caprae]CEJ37373.1 Putative uncharacterized protein [Mycobacterium tuberculosis variant bovis]
MSSTVGTEPKALPSSTTLANRFEVQPEAAGLRLMRKTGALRSLNCWITLGRHRGRSTDTSGNAWPHRIDSV